LEELALVIRYTLYQDMTNSFANLICGLDNLKTLKLKFTRGECEFSTFITQLKNKGQLKSFSLEASDEKNMGLLNFENWPSLQHLSISVCLLQPGQELGYITSFTTSFKYGDEEGTIGSMKFSSLKRFKLKLGMPYYGKYPSRSNVSTILVGIDRCAPELKDLQIELNEECLEPIMKCVQKAGNFVNLKRFVFKEIHSDNLTVLMK
jgi:hypothetical protein